MPRKSRAILLLLAVSLGLAPGLAASAPAPEPDSLLVFAAASLIESLQSLGSQFAAGNGPKVEFSFAGSNDLSRQIRAGAPADVFFSADGAKMDQVEAAGLVKAADRVDLLSNVLVVVVPSSSTTAVKTPQDLAALPRIALADPAAVPAGVYAKEWLEGLGLWTKMDPKVVPTLDVRSALAAVESEAAPAGIVYRTDAAIAKKAKVAFEVTNGPKITYVVAPLANAKNRAAAEAFVKFLESAAGKTEFEKRGFLFRAPK
ncbi:MAG TPA: molybdate ABC transporter substrate-binding protein [Thermoanaerobaculia bacterium]